MTVGWYFAPLLPLSSKWATWFQGDGEISCMLCHLSAVVPVPTIQRIKFPQPTWQPQTTTYVLVLCILFLTWLFYIACPLLGGHYQSVNQGSRFVSEWVCLLPHQQLTKSTLAVLHMLIYSCGYIPSLCHAIYSFLWAFEDMYLYRAFSVTSFYTIIPYVVACK